jgi:hypothetical protein
MSRQAIPNGDLLGRKDPTDFLPDRVGDGAEARQHLAQHGVRARPAVLHDSGDLPLLPWGQVQLSEHSGQVALTEPRHRFRRQLERRGCAPRADALTCEPYEQAYREREYEDRDPLGADAAE